MFAELGDILYRLSAEYQHIDIQDRAKFYYAMFTSLSSDKVRILGLFI